MEAERQEAGRHSGLHSQDGVDSQAVEKPVQQAIGGTARIPQSKEEAEGYIRDIRARLSSATDDIVEMLRRYIGEKGIGFKAVFGVADQVLIHSGHYSFKLDRGTRLGRVAPEWATFPSPLPGWPSLVLKLKPSVNDLKLREEVLKLDAQLLIFLRKLREVRIQLQSDSDRWPNACSTWRRLDGAPFPCGLSLRTVLSSAPRSYVISQHVVKGMPEEVKRGGCTESALVFGFPQPASPFAGPKHEEGSIPSHQVYSFLPVRDYGFNIAFHADFILSADRGGIVADSSYTELPPVNAAPLAPTLSSQASRSERFFRGLPLRVADLLADKQVLESQDGGGYSRPSELRLVPRSFGWEEPGRIPGPIIPAGRSAFRYVSAEYPEGAWDGLVCIGVKVLTSHEFLEDVSHFIASHQPEFQSMPPQWHGRLSEALGQLTAHHRGFIESLRLVPLQDGAWVAPREGPLIIPPSDPRQEIPRRIGRHIVHQSVMGIEARESLMRKFGAESFSKESVYRIIKCHNANDFDGKDREAISRDDLISHVAFLNRGGWTRSRDGKYPGLWVELEDGSRRPSHEAYIKGPAQDLASTLLADYKDVFPLLHSGYVPALLEEGGSWLQNELGLSAVPRLVKPNGCDGDFSLHPDFVCLMRKAPLLDVLTLISTAWEEHYGKWVVRDGSEKVRDVISSMEVPHRGGGSTALSNTCLARGGVLAALGMHALEPGGLVVHDTASHKVLSLPDPGWEGWDVLQHFGVTTEVTPESLVGALRRIKQSNRDGAAPQEVSRLYAAIEANLKRENKDKLVFLTSPHPRWVGLDECVWDGPALLKKTPFVKTEYPGLSDFFCVRLRLKNADWETLAAEAKKLTTGDSLPYVRALLFKLNDCMAEHEGQHRGLELRNSPIFPISTSTASSDTFSQLVIASRILGADRWYIADTPYLKTAFSGAVPLLALGAPDLSRIKCLLKHTGCGDRTLSALARKRPITIGKKVLDLKYTELLQKRSGLLARLLDPENPNKHGLVELLRGAQVYTVEEVAVVWTLSASHAPDRPLERRSRQHEAAVFRASDKIEIFLAKSRSNIRQPPPQLTTELMTVCEIDKNHVLFLPAIITASDPLSVERDMDAEGGPGRLKAVFLVPAGGGQHACSRSKGNYGGGGITSSTTSGTGASGTGASSSSNDNNDFDPDYPTGLRYAPFTRAGLESKRAPRSEQKERPLSRERHGGLTLQMPSLWLRNGGAKQRVQDTAELYNLIAIDL
ncbi:hypothetical protein B0H67DRAFT_639341 [Lasiosphaeris hirsuta]|uniref:Uncharacterized protein n=1 Tax=Lasiosphaeris hirsuta TaxID=260670 RepID=A0AA40ED17_9PEZI|nr:hypothetical protein B0H67DRAFT_639341 [Lasiosphaeris hirsuta]